MPARLDFQSENIIDADEILKKKDSPFWVWSITPKGSDNSKPFITKISFVNTKDEPDPYGTVLPKTIMNVNKSFELSVNNALQMAAWSITPAAGRAKLIKTDIEEEIVENGKSVFHAISRFELDGIQMVAQGNDETSHQAQVRSFVKFIKQFAHLTLNLIKYLLMVPVTSLRPGVTFEENGDIFEVLTYNNVHLRKTSSVVKIKVRSLKRGMTIDKSFGSNAQVNPVSLYKKVFQFLYKDHDLGYFMDPESFEQINIPLIKLTGYMFLREGETVSIRFHGNEPLSILISPKVKLKVTDTNPGVKGNSATNVYKDATLETGLKTKVPLFINLGDEIIVDTRDGSYTSRV